MVTKIARRMATMQKDNRTAQDWQSDAWSGEADVYQGLIKSQSRYKLMIIKVYNVPPKYKGTCGL